VTYWVDKIALLRIYRKPPRYGSMLMKVTRQCIAIAFVIHFGFSFWMLSNSLVFDTYKQNAIGAGTTSVDEIQKDSYSWVKINQRLNQYHSLAYAAAFGLFILAYILKTLIVSFMKKNAKTKGDSEGEVTSNNYFASLEHEHLESFIEKTQNEIEIYKEIIENPKYGNIYQSAKDDLCWYIERLTSKLQELEEISAANSTLSQEAIKSKCFVGDHTYDISEIYPYSYFLANENLLRRDLTLHPENKELNKLKTINETNEHLN